MERLYSEWRRIRYGRAAILRLSASAYGQDTHVGVSVVLSRAEVSVLMYFAWSKKLAGDIAQPYVHLVVCYSGIRMHCIQRDTQKVEEKDEKYYALDHIVPYC